MLLFDQNLSPDLVRRLADLFPGSSHTQVEGMARADDAAVWRFALDRDLTIVTKDADYPDLVVLKGSPPKVIWLRLGNCSTDDVEVTLRWNTSTVSDFLGRESVALLILPLAR